MTTIYFIRHCEADNSNPNGRIRPLTEKGMNDRKLVTEFLQDKSIDIVVSSPFKRAVDTVADFAEKNNFEIKIIEDFREQTSSRNMRKDNLAHYPFLSQQWADFSYTLADGECLAEVQERNIAALNQILMQYKDKNIVIGTHGTALSTIINYFCDTYGFNDFMAMVNILPWVVKMEFDDCNFDEMLKVNLFELNKNTKI